ncbi:protein of unknown function [Pseudomonas sp. JV551A1]|uniref:Uncharacterized protein n=1 Tax=Pseudomonas inefficax TaxID=2078786 RepID=A0AAQ1PF21_9PSED|nr:protein of unknown function [Pseudomonas sp. JV551A1]SPO63327.1 protein of unknown function [Pseudomonas inefficax]
MAPSDERLDTNEWPAVLIGAVEHQATI